MDKIKKWLRTDQGVRTMIVTLITSSIIFAPYLWGLVWGFGEGCNGGDMPWFGIWLMGALTLILTVLIGMLVGILVLGCITFIIDGEWEPFELLETIGDWVEDFYDNLITNWKNG